MQRFLTIWLLICAGPIMAQQYHFRHYQVEDGLSNNTSICTLQDSKGFLWFGTKDGLNRFDGYTFKVYRNNQSDSLSIGNNSIWRLYEDAKGIIWVGTERGLYAYDPSTEKFRFLAGCPRSEISGITSDEMGNLWFIAGFKLYKYVDSQKKLIVYNNNELLNFCTTVSRADDGTIWVGTIDGNIAKYYPHTDGFSRYSVFNHSRPTSSSWVEKIYDSGQGFLLIGTSNQGIKKFSLERLDYEDLLVYNEDKTDIYARDFIRRSANEYWIATENGIYIYDIFKDGFVHLVKNPVNPYALSDNAVYAFTKDRDGGIWACTYFGGVNYYPRQKIEFEKFFYTPGTNSLRGNAVREITQDHNGNIWVGTEDAGLSVYNPRNETFANYTPEDGTSDLAHTNIHGLLVDDNKLWIGTFEHGLDAMDIRTRKVVKHFSYGSGPYDLKSNFIHSLYKTRSGLVFIGTSNGLYIYNKAKDNFIPLNFFPPNTFFSAITEDTSGNIWIGTFKSGVYFYNPRIGKYGHLKVDYKQRERLSENRITNLSVTSQQSLLICTEDGLYKVDPRSLQATLYSTASGLPSDLIYSAIEDDTYFIWITTSKGLVRLDPKTGATSTFTQSTGLLSDQFNYASGFKDSRGLMYFGSAKGLIRFNPLQINSSTKIVPPLYITNLQVNNEDVLIEPGGVLKTSILNTPAITLSYAQSSISLDFAALNYTSSKTIRYAYKLQGLDENWNHIKTNRRVYFTNISPGDYTFFVRSTDSDGDWASNERMLRITILPPWWSSHWAYLAYFILLIIGVYAAIMYYHERHLAKQRRAMELFERSKEQEMLSSKIDFFTNIAHEIRTPLTLIKAPMEKLIRNLKLSPQNEKYLLVMNKNTDRLMDLTNQLLDFRRVEAGAFALTLEEKEINTLVKTIWNNFQPLAESKKIRLKMTEERVFRCKLDEEATTKIVSNLLDNAIKYCHSYVAVSIVKGAEGFVNIIISNDGPVIKDELTEKIFQPFFRSKQTDKITGTGIGLPLARSLAELQGGSLFVDANNDLNNFVFKLPTEEI